MNNIPANVPPAFVYSTLQWEEFGFRSSTDIELTLYIVGCRGFDYEIYLDEQQNKMLLFSADAKFKLDFFLRIRKESEDEQQRLSMSNKNQSEAKEKVESDIQKSLCKILRGTTEVWTPCGRIDLLTNDTVIEIKRESKWREGLGQLLAYAEYYPHYNKRLILFDGGYNKELAKRIEKVCQSNQVQVEYFKNNRLQSIQSMFKVCKRQG